MKKYCIYINKQTLTFAARLPKEADKYQLLEEKGFDFIEFYKKLKLSEAQDFFVISEHVKTLFKDVKKKLTQISAAGGLVENSKGEFLFIFRNKKWDLPKGKVEKGEKLKVTAVREVEEECGVTIEKRGQKLCKTYHIYEINGKVVLKRTNWYKMYVKGAPKLIPQKEEGITTASWVAATGGKEQN
jgi:hypothetical protein